MFTACANVALTERRGTIDLACTLHVACVCACARAHVC